MAFLLIILSDQVVSYIAGETLPSKFIKINTVCEGIIANSKLDVLIIFAAIFLYAHSIDIDFVGSLTINAFVKLLVKAKARPSSGGQDGAAAREESVGIAKSRCIGALVSISLEGYAVEWADAEEGLSCIEDQIVIRVSCSSVGHRGGSGADVWHYKRIATNERQTSEGSV